MHLIAISSPSPFTCQYCYSIPALAGESLYYTIKGVLKMTTIPLR